MKMITTKPPSKKEAIGNWTYSKKTEKGNGEKLKKYSAKRNLWVTYTTYKKTTLATT